MDQSFVSLVDTVKWPVTVIILVVVLRRPLGMLMLRTRRLQFKDKELHVEFDRLEKAAQQALPAPPTAEATKTVSIDLYELADTSPTAAIAEAWRSVESSARRLIASRGQNPDYDVPDVYRLIQEVLVGNGIVDERTGKIFEDLRRLRNKVTHAAGYRVSAERARQFVDLAIRMREHFDSLTRAQS